MQANKNLSIFTYLVLILGLWSSFAAPGASRFGSTDVNSPEFFPILPWDPLHGWRADKQDWKTNGLESIAECNFNMAGFVWPEDLPACNKLGLGAIVAARPEEKDSPARINWKALSDEQIEARIRGMVKAAGNNPALMGYFIMDEPGVEQFTALGKAVAAVKKYAPGKLAYINLFPDYATLGAPDRSQLGTSNYTEYLERFVQEVKPQVLSYDNYMVQFSDDLKNQGTAASYFRNMLEVRRVALEHGLPYLHIVAANQLRPGHTIPSAANLALQAYTTLAAGFRGVTWYTYYGRGYRYAAIGQDGAKTATWPRLQEINRQIATLAPVLQELRSTGVYYTKPAPVENLPVLPGQLIAEITGTAPLMIGEFEGKRGDRLAMIVNLSLERSTPIEVKVKDGWDKLSLVSAVDGKLRPFTFGKDGYWLTAGEGILLKLERRGAS